MPYCSSADFWFSLTTGEPGGWVVLFLALEVQEHAGIAERIWLYALEV